jgi:hypothetical protein
LKGKQTDRKGAKYETDRKKCLETRWTSKGCGTAYLSNHHLFFIVWNGKILKIKKYVFTLCLGVVCGILINLFGWVQEICLFRLLHTSCLHSSPSNWIFICQTDPFDVKITLSFAFSS